MRGKISKNIFFGKELSNMASSDRSGEKHILEEALIQKAAPHGVDNALVMLAKALDLPAKTIQMVAMSGCETPADWKFAVLRKPEDESEALRWDAVQSAGASDVGAMMVIAARASAK